MQPSARLCAVLLTVAALTVQSKPAKAPDLGWKEGRWTDALGEQSGRDSTARSRPAYSPLRPKEPVLAAISVRAMPQGDVRILLTASDPVDCIRRCEVRLKFDDEQSIPYDAYATDGRNVLSLQPAAGIVDYLSKSRRVRIVAPLLLQGEVVFDFEPGPLPWR